MLYERKVPAKLCKTPAQLHVLIYPCLKFSVCPLQLPPKNVYLPVKKRVSVVVLRGFGHIQGLNDEQRITVLAEILGHT